MSLHKNSPPNYIWKLYLAFLLLFSFLPIFAQIDAPKDTLKSHLPVEVQQESPLLSLPTEIVVQEELPSPSLSTDKEQITLQVASPLYTPEYPWMSNRISRAYTPWSMDYLRYNEFKLTSSSTIMTFSTHNTYPTMGTIIQSDATFIYQLHKRWTLTGGMYAAKYTMPSRMHGSHMDIGLNASAAYRINDFMRIRLYGQYSAYGKSNSMYGYMNPMYPQSHFGAIMELKLNDYVEIHGGMERVYNPTKMKWENVPVIYPVINFKKKK